MADNTPTVGWICADPLLFTMVEAMLEEKHEDRSIPPGETQVHLGRVGSVDVAISRLESPSAADPLCIAGDMTTAFTSIKAVLITGFSAGIHGVRVNMGDIVIRPAVTPPVHNAESGSLLMPSIAYPAVDVLRREVGVDGWWLSSNLPRSNGSPQFTHPAHNDQPKYPRLNYGDIGLGRQDIQSQDHGDEAVNKAMCFDALAAGSKTFTIPVIEILGIGKDVQSPQDDYSKRYAAANAVAYAKELLQVMQNNLIRSVEKMAGTENIVSPQADPSLPLFQLHQYPNYGKAVLLVISTENKGKRKILEEAFRERAPKDGTMHVITVPVASDVGEQPYNNAGAIGAYNRISNALTCLDTAEHRKNLAAKGIGTVIVASIESYIQTENIDRPTDYGIIVLHNATTCNTAVRVSSGVTVPFEYVNRARRFGYEGDQNQGRVTVGQILAANVPGLDKGDWHAVLAERSRYDLLKDAIREMQIPW